MISDFKADLIDLKLYDDSINGLKLYNKDESYINALITKYTIRYKTNIYYLEQKHIDICVYFTEKITNEQTLDIILQYDLTSEAFDNFMKIIYGLTASISHEQVSDIFLITYELNLNQNNLYIESTLYLNTLSDLICRYHDEAYIIKLYDIALINQLDTLCDVFINKIKLHGWRTILRNSNVIQIHQKTFEKLMELHSELKSQMLKNDKVHIHCLNAKETFDLIGYYVSKKLHDNMKLRVKYNKEYILHASIDKSSFWIQVWQLSEDYSSSIIEQLDKNDKNLKELQSAFKDTEHYIQEVQENLKAITMKFEIE